MNSEALTTAIQAYFAGERHEGFAILAFSAGLVLVAAAVHVTARDGFSRGFGAVAVLLAVLLSSTVVSLIRRDTPHQAELIAAVRGGDARAAVAAEAGRMAEVIRKYPYYRTVALGLGLFALVAVAMSRRAWVNGAAAGVLLVVVAQVAIDHYSEARAMRYAGHVRAALEGGTVKIILFGATGMVGQGVLRECLLAPDVERVLAVGRHPTGQQHANLEELVVPDLFDLTAHASRLSGYDACFFCLGVSSAGMNEASYRRVTKDLTLSIAGLLAAGNPRMTFVYVSGAGTDATERGRSMWARVKGETENALLRLPFKAAFMFRPGFIQPLHGASSRTPWVRAFYAVTGPLFPVLDRLVPRWVTTTERLGRAMLAVARNGASTSVLENRKIDRTGRDDGTKG